MFDGLAGYFACFGVHAEQLFVVESALKRREVVLGLVSLPQCFLVRDVAAEPVRLVLHVAGQVLIQFEPVMLRALLLVFVLEPRGQASYFMSVRVTGELRVKREHFVWIELGAVRNIVAMRHVSIVSDLLLHV